MGLVVHLLHKAQGALKARGQGHALVDLHLPRAALQVAQYGAVQRDRSVAEEAVPGAAQIVPPGPRQCSVGLNWAHKM